MPATLDCAALNAAVRRVSPALGKERATYAGLSLTVSGGRTTVAAQNADSYFQAYCSADPADQLAQVVVPGVMLRRHLASLESMGGGDVLVEPAANLLRLTTHRSMVEFPTLATEWVRRDVPLGREVRLSSGEVGRLSSVLAAAHPDPERGALFGVHLNGHTATCSDQFRLARADLDADLPLALPPAIFLREALSGSSDDVTIITGGTVMAVVDDGGYWLTSLLVARFPAVDHILSARVQAEFEVDVDELREALQIAAVVDTEMVTIKGRGGSLLISASTGSAGVAEATVRLSGRWDDTRSVNRRQLMTATDNLDALEAAILVTDRNFLQLRGARITHAMNSVPS